MNSLIMSLKNTGRLTVLLLLSSAAAAPLGAAFCINLGWGLVYCPSPR
jgi:hypothetical protein